MGLGLCNLTCCVMGSRQCLAAAHRRHSFRSTLGSEWYFGFAMMEQSRGRRGGETAGCVAYHALPYERRGGQGIRCCPCMGSKRLDVDIRSSPFVFSGEKPQLGLQYKSTKQTLHCAVADRRWAREEKHQRQTRLIYTNKPPITGKSLHW